MKEVVYGNWKAYIRNIMLPLAKRYVLARQAVVYISFSAQ